MKKTSLKILSFLLVLMQMQFSFASCSGQTGETDNGGKQDTESVSGTETVYTGLEDRDCDGYSYRIFMRGDMGNAYGARHRDAFTVEEYNGETIHDAVYDRQLALIERYNFQMEFIPVTDNASAFASEYRQLVEAGDDAFDVAIASSDYQQSSVLGGYALSWTDLEHIDLTQPWWNQSAIESLSIKDTVFYTMGDMTFDLMDYTYLVYFNKALCEEWGITADSLYDTVLDGKWTLS